MAPTQVLSVLPKDSNVLPDNFAKFLADLSDLLNIVALDQAVHQGCDLISQSEQAPLGRGKPSLLR